MAEAEIRGSINVLQIQIERIAGRLDGTDQHNTVIIDGIRSQIGHLAQSQSIAKTGPRKEMRLLLDKDVKPQFFNGGPREDYKE